MNLFGGLIFSSSLISSHFTTCLLIFILHFSPQLPSSYSNRNRNRLIN
ncbi:hypothetical protein N665_1043s0013 [Sinapis alba]|nr:hypothetical protein N665_1043s0013 [Sinapis alba]